MHQRHPARSQDSRYLCRIRGIVHGAEHIAALVDENRRPSDHGDLRVGVQEDGLQLEAVRDGDIVGVQPREVLPSGFRTGEVERPAQAACRRAHKPDAGVSPGELGQYLRCSVRRSVIDDDQLEIAKRLRQHALDGFFEKHGAVADRHHDAHRRILHRHAGGEGTRTGRRPGETRCTLGRVSSIVAPAPLTEVRPGPRPTFSVVIPVFQAAATIGDAIASVRAQTFAPLEIIVCDDGSTDDLDAALAPHADAITLLRQENRGVVAARNALLAAATGEFVAPLDADDVYSPTRLERLADLGAERPDLDILATDAYFVADGRVVGRFNRQTPFAVERQADAILDRCFLIVPAMRRERLVALGGYDEHLRTAEDWDCCIRLIHAGSAAGLVDEPLLEYRLRSESLTSRRSETLRDRVRMLDKVAAREDLSPLEKHAVRASLRRHRSRALQQIAREAVAEAKPDARTHLLAVARSRDVPLRVRARAAVAAIAPPGAGRALVARFDESTGRPAPVPPDRSA
jgi:hypothetical protein